MDIRKHMEFDSDHVRKRSRRRSTESEQPENMELIRTQSKEKSKGQFIEQQSGPIGQIRQTIAK